jgi:type VI secretion system protein ImpL
MKSVLLKIFKGFLILSVLLLAALLLFGLVLLIGWPWWVGFFILLGLAGSALGAWVLRKFLKRRHEQMFIHQVVAQDEAARTKLAPKEQNAAKELQARWKEAVETLRKSHLRKYGNPLYILPWYMIIGESGSGKTTAIESARLSSPFSEVTRTSGISGTRNCDWWFFDQSIIIDTAGRYAIPVDEGRDKDEWQKFLNLLAKFRKKEPLNGLVVTIAADRLAQNTAESLQEDGRSIRRRIDELMRVLGAKFPVYIMVTKCDLIQGATHFCSSLPEDALNQAMGVLNHSLSTDVQAFINNSFQNVSDRLRDLRLLLLNKIKGPSRASAMLLFPEEFEKLQTPLTAFIQGALEENPYQETPLLRGLYFSSGRQEGTPFSNFLKALNLIQEREVLAGTNKGLFLHDLFDKILPRDRRIFRPTQHMVRWRRLTRNMGLTAWVSVMTAACGLLSYVFVENLSILSEVRREFNKPAILQGDLLPDVITLNRFRLALKKVEKENKGWWIPRLGLRESLQVETALKHKFVTLFHSGFLTEFDKAMVERMTRFGAHTPSVEYGAHVVHLARRINLLKERLSRNDLAELSVLPQPVYYSHVLNRSDVIPEIRKKLGVQYLYAITWQKDHNELNKEMAQLQTWLKHLLTLPDMTLNWLANWVNADPALSAVGMHDFWGGQPDPDLAAVPAAFSRAGKAKIEAAIADIETALFDPLIMAGLKMDFDKWYENAFVAAWQDFVQAFDTGKHLLKGRGQWQAVAKKLNSPKGPYYALIDHAVAEFEALGKDFVPPPWIALAKDWQLVRKESTSPDVIDPNKAGILQKAKRSVTSQIRKAENTLGVKAARKSMNAQDQFSAAKFQRAYQSGLDESIKATTSQHVAFQMASDLYSQDAATGQSPLLAARRSLTQIKAVIGDAHSESETPFWDLLGGNIRFMQQYISKETACALQSRWETDVLMEVQDVSSVDRNMGQLMMGSGGFASEFINGPAKPFITRSYKKGYYPKKALGMEIPFDKDFLEYLTKGAQAARPRKKNYHVKVRAYPTDTNRDAAMRPQSTLLEMQCADKRIRLENFNFPVAKDFTWSPQECGDVSFQISVGNLVLTKTYRGYNAFAKFLHAFKTGSHTFHRSDFPSEEAALRRIGVKYVKAKYQFQGHRAALRMLYSAPGRPPRNIITCWE